MKFLIADDHAILREGLIKLIKSNYPFCECDEVADGNDLLMATIKNKYDLIITDINMPNLNGIEAVKKIKSNNKDAKVLILSMYSETQYGVRAIKNGASGYLTKQNASTELIKAIELLLANKKYFSQELVELLAESVTGDSSNLPLHEKLSEREMMILEKIVSGSKLKDIAASLNITISTVSTFRDRILKKLEVSTNSDLFSYAISNQLFPHITKNI